MASNEKFNSHRCSNNATDGKPTILINDMGHEDLSRVTIGKRK
jgi:hypothetical protein